MGPTALVDRLARQEWLDPLVNRVRSVVQVVVRPQPLRDVLHGRPLGHPLHPSVVDVPIGAWFSAAVLDTVPGVDDDGAASTLLVATGLAAALPSVASGWTDWSEMHEDQMRVGLVHAVANALGSACYAVSLVHRLRGDRAAGRSWGYAGLTAVGVGGFLGGHLAFRQAAGANHAEHVLHLAPGEWTPVAALADLPPGEPTVAQAGTVQVLLHRRPDGGVDALADTCSHLSAPLHEGELTTGADGRTCVVCPWHGSTFRLADGAVVRGPATAPQPRFATDVRDGTVYVRPA